MEDQIMNILDSVFECTLEMINKDFSEYPEHRVEFFKLLRTINLRCFPALLRLDSRQFKFIIDYTSILQDVLFVLTDSDHKAGFKSQSLLLQKMFYLIESGKIQGPVYSPDMAPQGTSNKEFLKNFAGNLLANAFPNLAS